jgi:hypothetical protein
LLQLDIYHHSDFTFFFGDLNYRVDLDINAGSYGMVSMYKFVCWVFWVSNCKFADYLPNKLCDPFLYSLLHFSQRMSHAEMWAKTAEMVEEGRIDELMEKDQLLREQERKHVFAYFMESAIKFKPTFKVC